MIRGGNAPKAWMLSKYGEAIPVKVHLYVDKGVFSEGIDALLWLYSVDKGWVFPRFQKELTNWFIELLINYLGNHEEQDRLLDLGTAVDWKEMIIKACRANLWTREDPNVFSIIEDSMPLIDTSNWTFGTLKKYIDLSVNTGNIETFLNNRFIRVRDGDMYDSRLRMEDKIYFRISSVGYDWRRVIEEFMWNTYGSIENMPEEIWIGNDYETKGNSNFYVNMNTAEYFKSYDSKIMSYVKDRQDEFCRINSGHMNPERIERLCNSLWLDLDKFTGNLKESVEFVNEEYR